jgi:hypothetical protein
MVRIDWVGTALLATAITLPRAVHHVGR